MIHYLTPYRSDKNLGKAYNDAMRLIPDGDTAVLMDIDVMFLLPEQPSMIEWHVLSRPDAVLTCYTNRISDKSPQLYKGITNPVADIREHIDIAERVARNKTIMPVSRCISGFLMVVPKSVWQRVPFPETGKCLAVDTVWSRQVLAKGIHIGLMTDIYVWHTYRLRHGIADKKHLL